MKSIKYHLPPNVTAGTNFNVARFRELYSWIEAGRADVLSLSLSAYGLLCDEKGHPAFNLQINGNTIQLSQCLAITKGGVLLSVLPESTATLSLDIDPALLNSQPYLELILVADLKGTRQSTGQADSSEIPLRAPYSILPYRLELHVPDTLNGGGDFLKIGEVIYNNGAPVLSDYLPACAQSGAHLVMWNRIMADQAQLKDFYQALKMIIKNVDTAKENSVVVSFAKLCREMGAFLAAHIPKMKAANPYSNPQEFFDLIMAFAERTDFEWQINPRHTEMLELIQYNVRNSTNNFELGILEDLSQHTLQQSDTNKTLDLIEQFKNGFVLPIISMSSQSRIMKKQEQTVWEEKKTPDRNMW